MIKLDDVWRIEVDSSCWILVEKYKATNRKTGGENEYERQTYHGTLAQAIKFYIDQQLSPSGSLKEVLAAIAKLDKKVDELFGGIKKNEFISTGGDNEASKRSSPAAGGLEPTEDLQPRAKKAVAGKSRSRRGK